MTAERDRLADLLRNAHVLGRYELADRLIAAGVVLIGDHNPHDAEVFRRGFERGHHAKLLEDPPADIDVERLARALNATGMVVAGLAAAIAAAYREDAG